MFFQHTNCLQPKQGDPKKKTKAFLFFLQLVIYREEGGY